MNLKIIIVFIVIALALVFGYNLLFKNQDEPPLKQQELNQKTMIDKPQNAISTKLNDSIESKLKFRNNETASEKIEIIKSFCNNQFTDETKKRECTNRLISYNINVRGVGLK